MTAQESVMYIVAPNSNGRVLDDGLSAAVSRNPGLSYRRVQVLVSFQILFEC